MCLPFLHATDLSPKATAAQPLQIHHHQPKPKTDPMRRLEVWRRMRTELLGVPCAESEAAMFLSMPAVMESRLGPLLLRPGSAAPPPPLALLAPPSVGGFIWVGGCW